MAEYTVKPLTTKDIRVRVPGSKSITNRALMIAALSDGTSYINGIQTSKDAEHFINCLVKLGFFVDKRYEHVIIKGNNGVIPKKKAEIYVGSAGTAARFLTAMLALSDGEYTINASEQMKSRPMKELIQALMDAGAEFKFYENEYSLPFTVKGAMTACDKDELHFDINIDKSSQFLSALLMAAPMTKKKVSITLAGKRTAKSYVRITEKVMEAFGVNVLHNSEDEYIIEKDSFYKAGPYRCEPDVSAACYFYAMAAVCGACGAVFGVHKDSMQGDIEFLSVLRDMGCTVTDTDYGVAVSGPKLLKGIEVNMSDFSDQALTLAAIAPFTDTGVTIRGIGHIRNQESDRIQAMYNELTKMGIACTQYDDGISIKPGVVKPCLVDTYNDHRVAMAFSLCGLKAPGMRIDNPECCSKTFTEYFDILDGLCS